MNVKIISCALGEYTPNETLEYKINSWLNENKEKYFEPIVDIKLSGDRAMIMYNERRTQNER